MGRVVAGIVALQQVRRIGKCVAESLQVSVVGGIAAVEFDQSNAALFFRYLSLLNLNIQVVKPGCTVPIIGFVDLFWYTQSWR